MYRERVVIEHNRLNTKLSICDATGPGITLRGVWFQSLWQWIVFAKASVFGDMNTVMAVLNTTCEDRLQRLDWRITRYDERLWETRRGRLMSEGIRAKAETDKKFREQLLARGDRDFVEISTRTNDEWVNRRNEYGRCLTLVKNELGR